MTEHPWFATCNKDWGLFLGLHPRKLGHGHLPRRPCRGRCGRWDRGHARSEVVIIAAVDLEPLSLDTSADIEERQVESWRQMSAAHKAAIITGLTRAAYAMASAGVRHRYPGASPREQFLRLAVLVLGHELASLAYPDVTAEMRQ